MKRRNVASRIACAVLVTTAGCQRVPSVSEAPKTITPAAPRASLAEASLAAPASAVSVATTEAPPRPLTTASAPSPIADQSLPISVKPFGGAPEMEGSDILHPETCTLKNGIATAIGKFNFPAPEIYRRVGGHAVLHVYASPAQGRGVGVELADLDHQEGHVWKDSSLIYGDGPWSISVSVNVDAGVPTSCQVAIERAQPYFFLGAPG
jgi:hypothetical protein